VVPVDNELEVKEAEREIGAFNKQLIGGHMIPPAALLGICNAWVLRTRFVDDLSRPGKAVVANH
jgi:hypothetical protein